MSRERLEGESVLAGHTREKEEEESKTKGGKSALKQQQQQKQEMGGSQSQSSNVSVSTYQRRTLHTNEHSTAAAAPTTGFIGKQRQKKQKY